MNKKIKLPTIQIKKILYATDLSETAVHGFAYAVSLADTYGADITILHVLAGFIGETYVTSMIDPDTWKEIQEKHYSEARDKLIGKRRDHMAMQEVLQAFSDEAMVDDESQIAHVVHCIVSYPKNLRVTVAIL